MVHANVRVGGAFAGFAAPALVQRAGKPRKFARVRWMAVNARSSWGDELCFVWCHWWGSIFGQPSSFSRRGCARGFGRLPPFRRREGTARQMARQSLICTPSCDGVAPSGAPSGVLLRRRAALFVTVRMMDGPPVSHLLAGNPYWPPRRSPGAAWVRGLLATPAGGGPLHTSRRNRFASLMRADNYRYIIL